MMNRRECLRTAALLGLPWTRTARAVAMTGPEQRALHALNRLGHGPRPQDMEAMQRLGAEAWLQQFLDSQLSPATQPLPEGLQTRLAALDTRTLGQAELLQRFRDANQAANAARAERAAGAASATVADAAQRRRELVRPIVQQAGAERLWRALESPAQLEEVLVDFWFNHFNVFAGKGPVAVLIGDYERQAIRPHVLGSFRALLGATAKHPAMLVYLDNVQSVAPGYQAPRRADAGGRPPPSGLNENYARELMELHTLGVDGGYTQRDVTELARMLTGWTVDYRALRRGAMGSAGGSLFVFDPRRHDHGAKQWLGRSVAPAGQAEGEMALDVLAAHPATARHIAFKLAQAFVADAPPPALVQRLAARFSSSGGDLREVMRSLLTAEEFWSADTLGAKFKTPYQYLLSALRAVGATGNGLDQTQPLLGALAQAGMPLYGCATPDGYKNTAAAWQNAEALAQRVQLASSISARAQRGGAQPVAGLQRTLGPLLSTATRETVAAEPPEMQLALLLASPDFMRR